jgi:hypothetical protein
MLRVKRVSSASRASRNGGRIQGSRVWGGWRRSAIKIRRYYSRDTVTITTTARKSVSLWLERRL